MNRTLGVLIAILCLALAVPLAGQSNLVKNGGFETPVNATTPSSPFYPSGTVGLEWIVEWADTPGSIGNLEIWRGDVLGISFTPAAGQQNAELDTHGRPGTYNANVRIFQDIATCPSANYTLAYSWRPRPGVSSSSSMGVEVKWGGALLATHTGAGLPWTNQTTTVQGSFASQRLMFTGTGTGDQLGILLDAVSLAGPDPNAVNGCTSINIKPFSDPNSINVCSAGNVPVTIWGSANLDVSTVDPAQLLLGGVAVRMPGKSGKYQCSIADSGRPDASAFDGIGAPDGYPDLTCHFTTEANMFPVDATSATVSMTVCADGFATGCLGKPSVPLSSADAVRIVKDGCL